MSKTTPQVHFSFKGRIKVSSPADRSKIESAGAKFFDEIGTYCFSWNLWWPYRLEVKFPDGGRLRFSRPKSDSPAPTERQQQILREVLMPMFLKFLEDCASIGSTEAVRQKIKRNKEQHEKAVFGRRGKRAGAELLIAYRNAELYYREKPERDSFMIVPMALLNAVKKDNTEFAADFVKAMRRSQTERERIKKRLIETDELRHPTSRILTWKEIKEKYAPDYKDSPENFQHLLDECGIDYEKVGEFRRKHVKNRKKNTC